MLEKHRKRRTYLFSLDLFVSSIISPASRQQHWSARPPGAGRPIQKWGWRHRNCSWHLRPLQDLWVYRRPGWSFERKFSYTRLLRPQQSKTDLDSSSWAQEAFGQAWRGLDQGRVCQETLLKSASKASHFIEIACSKRPWAWNKADRDLDTRRVNQLIECWK